MTPLQKRSCYLLLIIFLQLLTAFLAGIIASIIHSFHIPLSFHYVAIVLTSIILFATSLFLGNYAKSIVPSKTDVHNMIIQQYSQK